jgi:heme o synthase
MDFIRVTKPLLVLANLITAAAGFFLAAKGHFHFGIFLAAMLGITLLVASGCVLNNCIDRNIDKHMTRTHDRALARGSMSLQTGLGYALGLAMAGAAVLLAGTNRLTLAIVFLGLVIYVGVYSAYLKRRSPYSTLIGSLAGAAAPLAAYCAVSGRFDLGAILVLAIFSLWQIPHSYAITIMRYDDYAAASIPVLPLKHGIAATKQHIVWHVAAFALAAMLLSFFQYTGTCYLIVASLVGGLWIILALAARCFSNELRWAKTLYIFSIAAIVVLSVMMSVDYAEAAFL